MPSVQSYDTVEQFYVAYYQRPGDPTGERFWADRLELSGGDLSPLLAAFGNSPESAALYGPIDSTTIGHVIDEIYLGLFNRLPDPAGKQFYTDGFNNGTYTAASIAYNVLAGAQNDDAVAVTNKLQAASQFTQTVDGRTFADPNFGQGTSFEATYAGEADAAAGRAFLDPVDANPQTVPSESQTISFIQTNVANPGDPILNIVPGATLNLTTSVDDIHVPPGGATDLVKGFFTDVPLQSTLTPADSITGNNNTIFKLAVDLHDTFKAAPFFEMIGVNQVQVLAAGGGTISMDGGTMGDIGSVALSGADGLAVTIENLDLAGKVDISVAGGTSGTVFISGALDGIGMSATAANAGEGSITSVSLALAGIDLVAGKNSTAEADLYQTSSDTGGAVSVGDLTIGDIAMNVGTAAFANLSITNSVDNFGAGSSKVGSLTVGDVSMNVGSSASASLYLYNSAYVATGPATVGNLTIGNIDVALGTSASVTVSAFNSAYSSKGSALVGDITVGNVTVSGGDTASATVEFSNSASAHGSGNAKVGNVTVGDVSMTVGDSGTADLFVYNFANSDKGSATTGNLTVGDVHMEVGDSGSAYFSAENTASATTGAATVGNSTIGNIDMVAGVSSTASAEFFFSADTSKGAATVGDVTIGDVNLTAGVGGTSYLEVSVHAQGTSGDSVGNTTVGAVNLYGSADAFVGYSVSVTADFGTVGDVTLGDVKERVENGGDLSYSVEIDGSAGIGDVQVGDINLSWGSGATLDYFNLSVSASDGDIGSFSVGDISIATEGVDAITNATGVYVFASGDIGDVNFGNISISMAKSASFSQSWTVDAADGNLGNVTLGDVSLVAATNANASLTMYFSAADEIGNITQGNIGLVALAGADVQLSQYFSASDQIGDVTVGNISLLAAKSAAVSLYHEVYNSDDIGNITYGNISLVANGKDANVYAFISAENDDGHDIGTITAGTVNLTAKGEGADSTLTLSFTSADTIGPVTVGNITMEAQNVKAGATAATVNLDVWDLGGTSDLTLGDIKLTGNTGVTAAWVTTAKVSADFFISSDDDINIGNISVIGGNKVGAVVMDNFGDLKTMLDLHAGGSITVGDIDYSGYKAAAIIDASTWKGAANITASSGGSDIYDNKTKNVITLGAGQDDVFITNTNTGKLTAAAVDQIIGFSKSGGDLMHVDLGGTDFAYSAAPRTYAEFLVAAASAMSVNGVDIFSQKIGSDSFIAFDKDANGTLDFVVEVVGVQIDTDASFVIT